MSEDSNLTVVIDEQLPALRNGSALPALPDANIGAITLTREEREVLDREPEAHRMAVRPDPQRDGSAVIYLPHEWYRDRLRSALGFGAFGLKTLKVWTEPAPEQHDPDTMLVYVWGALFVKGSFVADSIGTAKYRPSNRQQDYSDSFKSAKSNCFVRCCSDAGLGTEPWSPSYREKFIREHCVKVLVKVDGKPQPRWRLKDSLPFENEMSSSNADSRRIDPALNPEASRRVDGAGSISDDGAEKGKTDTARSSVSTGNRPPAEQSDDISLDLNTEAGKATPEQIARWEELKQGLNDAAIAAWLKQRRVKEFGDLSAKQAANVLAKLENATA
jgi:Mitochondrial genome maintenance MGM101